ncbi:hypothetical protein [Subtercola lobariae]|uniref:hypothetical protein n=1 Tax=Subtercola lobariae TaxID=1588641 RepID=UPI00166B543C
MSENPEKFFVLMEVPAEARHSLCPRPEPYGMIGSSVLIRAIEALLEPFSTMPPTDVKSTA